MIKVLISSALVIILMTFVLVWVQDFKAVARRNLENLYVLTDFELE